MTSFNSFRSFKSEVEHLISKADFDSALKLTHDYVDKIITESLLTSKILESRELDSLCQRIGFRNLERLKSQDLIDEPNVEIDKFIYVVTKIQKSGGLINVIENFIKNRPFSTHTANEYRSIYLAKQGF
jgi:hypothetical protein